MDISQTADSYDEQWNRLHDFIQFNPGARHRRRLLEETLKQTNLTQPTVIDAGCGLGFNVSAIISALPDSNITGIDFSATAIEGAARRFPNHHWKVVNLNTPSELFSADVVVCTEVIEHVDDPLLLLQNLNLIVRRGGFLVLTTQSGKIHQTEKMVGHLQHFKINQLEESLCRMGYQIRSSTTWGWPGYVIIKYVGNINARRTMDALGSGRYGFIARTINYVAFIFSGIFSRENSSRGSQIVLLAQKANV
jgi:2-polyprenyl-3-methyl-5-hydroxy-6-metoxy-1,4-benzoquinol methylase